MEKETAEKMISELEKESGKKVFVSVEPFKAFYTAEEEHQDYYLKHPAEFEKELIESVSTSIKGVLDADRKKLIMMNVKSQDLDKVKEVMPSMGGLTISEVLSNEKTVAVQAVIDEKEVFELVNDLRNAGAKDILVMPIERII